MGLRRLRCRSLAAVTAAAARRIGSAGRREGRGFEPLPLTNPTGAADRRRRHAERNRACRGPRTAGLDDNDDDDDDDVDGEDEDEEDGNGSRSIPVTFEWGAFVATSTVALCATESVAQAKMQLREHGRHLATAQGAATPTLAELDLQAHFAPTASLPAATVTVTSVKDVLDAESLSCCQTPSKARAALPHRGNGRFDGSVWGGRQNQKSRPAR